jgi:hypothetical protein
MYKLILSVSILSLLLSKCGKKSGEESQVPPEILSKEVFTKVLTDFALAESAANMNVKNTDLRKLDSVYAFNPLIDNGVTQSQYDSAITYYIAHRELYKEVYENVLVALSELQANRNPVVKDTSAK